MDCSEFRYWFGVFALTIPLIMYVTLCLKYNRTNSSQRRKTPSKLEDSHHYEVISTALSEVHFEHNRWISSDLRRLNQVHDNKSSLPPPEDLYIQPEIIPEKNSFPETKKNFNEENESNYLTVDNPGNKKERNVTSNFRKPPSPTSAEKYPCLNPVNESMRELGARLSSFNGALNWPTYRLKATIQEVAMAGLYYSGKNDLVYCWYCGGTLENWSNNDDPWIQHAWWYPRCEFMLKCKGIDFIAEIHDKIERNVEYQEEN